MPTAIHLRSLDDSDRRRTPIGITVYEVVCKAFVSDEALTTIDPTRATCVRCQAPLRNAPHLAYLHAQKAGVPIAQLIIGPSNAELRRRARKAKTPAGQARNLHELEKRELYRDTFKGGGSR